MLAGCFSCIFYHFLHNLHVVGFQGVLGQWNQNLLYVNSMWR
jgi:hypothetical protein